MFGRRSRLDSCTTARMSFGPAVERPHSMSCDVSRSSSQISEARSCRAQGQEVCKCGPGGMVNKPRPKSTAKPEGEAADSEIQDSSRDRSVIIKQQCLVKHALDGLEMQFFGLLYYRRVFSPFLPCLISRRQQFNAPTMTA